MSFVLNPESQPIESRFKLTLDYLKQSNLAKLMIEELEASARQITVFVSRQGDDVYSPPATAAGGGTIRWNYLKTLKTANEVAHRPHKVAPEAHHGFEKQLGAAPRHLTKRGLFGRHEVGSMEGFMSPALALMHELGHAYQWLTMRDVESATHDEAHARWGARPDSAHRKAMENVNVNAVENTVAMELRAKGFAEGIRWRYDDHAGATEETEETFPGYLTKASRH